MQIPIAKPLLGLAEEQAVSEVIRSGWLMQGDKVAAFEAAFAKFVGAAAACAVSSGTAALHLALWAAGVGPGDEVITVSHSFVATASSVRLVGAEPVFVDIDPATFNIDPNRVRAAVTPRTRAILCAHQMGMPCDMAALSEIARASQLLLIEDAACALGSEIEWRGAWQPIGRPIGDVACFSFHPRKVVTTGDGGMVTARSPELLARVRRLRQHGIESLEVGAVEVGANYRLTDLQAAVGIVQLTRLPEMVRERRELASRYRALLADESRVSPPMEPAWARSNWQSFCVRLDARVDAASVREKMDAHGVATRSGLANAHEQAAHREHWLKSSLRRELSQSEAATQKCVLLPLYNVLSHAEQDYVVDALRSAL